MASCSVAASQLANICPTLQSSNASSSKSALRTACYFGGSLASPLSIQKGNTFVRFNSSSTPKRTARRFCVRNDLDEPVTIDNGTVLIVGGGGLGMETLRPLARKGSWVTAFHRTKKFQKEIEGLGAFLAIGDVLEPQTLEKVFRSNTFDAVVCTVGGGLVDTRVDSEGAINAIKAAEKAKVPRFVLVTSIGTGNSEGAISEKELEILGPVLKAKLEAEEYLKQSQIEKWTIVRPGGLLSTEATGTGFLTEDPAVVGLISRAEVADLLLKILFNEDANGKVLAAVDDVKQYGVEKEIKKFALA